MPAASETAQAKSDPVPLSDFNKHRKAPSRASLQWILNAANPHGNRHPLRACLLRLGTRWYVDLVKFDAIIAEQLEQQHAKSA